MLKLARVKCKQTPPYWKWRILMSLDCSLSWTNDRGISVCSEGAEVTGFGLCARKAMQYTEYFTTDFYQMDSTFAAFKWFEKNLFGWQGGLKNAFDMVDQSVLLNKLYHYGNCRIARDWSASYLSGRTQTTEVNSLISRKQIVPYGVPQDSVLEALLFSLYTTDFFNSSKKLDFYLFADDTNMLFADKNLKSLETTINNELY